MEMNKVLISALKRLDFLGAVTTEWQSVFDAVFSRAY